MFLGLTGKLLFGVAFLFPLVVASGQYPDSAKSTKTTVTVHVVWLPSFKAVDAFCSLDMPKGDGKIVGCFDPKVNTIYAVEPKNFNDAVRLEILGHEFWHALGARHPA